MFSWPLFTRAVNKLYHLNSEKSTCIKRDQRDSDVAFAHMIHLGLNDMSLKLLYYQLII